MKKQSIIYAVIFFGALWGAIEATLGYVLQLMPHFVSGFIMFPIAALILVAAYHKTHSAKALLMVGAIAAMIKSINLFFPMNHWRTINPMVAIVLESLMVMAVIGVVVHKPLQQKILAFSIASLGWRLLYLGYMGVQFITTGFLHDNLTSMSSFIAFVFVQGLLGAALALMLYYVLEWMRQHVGKTIQIKPVTATLMVVIAIALTVIL